MENVDKIEELMESLTLDDFLYDDDKELMDNEFVSYLLWTGRAFLNCYPYLSYNFSDWKDGRFQNVTVNPDPNPETIVVFLNCSDLFCWGCSDAIEVKTSELRSLAEFHFGHSSWGISKWVCKKRNMRPQKPIQKLMKGAGVWEDWMDKLQANPDEYYASESLQEHLTKTESEYRWACVKVTPEERDQLFDRLIEDFPEYSKYLSEEKEAIGRDVPYMFWPNRSVHCLFLYGFENVKSQEVSTEEFVEVVLKEFPGLIKTKEITKDKDREDD